MTLHLFAVGLHTCTAVAHSLCVSWAFLSLNGIYHNPLFCCLNRYYRRPNVANSITPGKVGTRWTPSFYWKPGLY